MDSYVTRNSDGALRVADTRVTLSSVVHGFWQGEAPETIVTNFPALSLEQVYGALAWYLGHRDEVDRELADLESEIDRQWAQAQKRNRDLRERLLRVRVLP